MVKKGAVAALVILSLVGIEIGLDDYGARIRLAALKRDVSMAYKNIDPDAKRIVDPAAQLRGKITEVRKLSAGMGDAATETMLLDIFREISRLAPADFLLTSFNLDGNAIGLRGEVRNFDAVETLRKTFANSKTFKAVVIGSTGMVKQGSGVEFELKMTLEK